MSDKSIDTIVFDLGGVLVNWDPANVYRKIFKGDEKKTNWFLNEVCTPEWNIEQDAGRTIEEAVDLKVAEFPEHKELISMYYEQWEFMFDGVIQENLNLLRSFFENPNLKVFALTNWSAEKWPRALELFPFFNDFDGVIVSGQEKTRKPFDKIYRILLNRFDLNPASTIFIDDNSDNVIAAKNLGINSIHFQNHKQLMLEISGYNIP